MVSIFCNEQPTFMISSHLKIKPILFRPPPSPQQHPLHLIRQR